VVNPNWLKIRCSPTLFRQATAALMAIRNQLRVDCPLPGGGLPSRVCLGTKTFGYRQGDGSTGPWEEAQTDHGYRYYPGRDKQAAISALDGAAGPHILKNVEFGLPISYSWGKAVDVWFEGKSHRRPSPISFRVCRMQDDQFAVFTLLFKSRFLPSGAEIRLGNAIVQPPPNWTYLDRFIGGCGNAVTF